MKLIKEMTAQDAVDLRKLLDTKVKMDPEFQPFLLKAKNRVLKDEFCTKWAIHPEFKEKDLMKLYILSNWAEDEKEAFRLLPIVLSDLLFRNPELVQLTPCILYQFRGEDPYNTIKDIVAGVASRLNYDDIEYFLTIRWNERPDEISELGEFAKSLIKCYEHNIESGYTFLFEDADNVQTVDFVLSETTANKIINTLTIKQTA
jgi:hypothetical protein